MIQQLTCIAAHIQGPPASPASSSAPVAAITAAVQPMIESTGLDPTDLTKEEEEEEGPGSKYMKLQWTFLFLTKVFLIYIQNWVAQKWLVWKGIKSIDGMAYKVRLFNKNG